MGSRHAANYRLKRPLRELAALGLSVALAASASAEPKSSSNGPPDENRCLVRIWVRATGLIQAAQVVRSSGHPRLDEACALGVIAQPMKPPTLRRESVDQWVTLPIKWVMQDMKSPAPAETSEGQRIAQLTDQVLLVDVPYYPAAAINERKEGVCRLHVVVSAAGDVDDIQLTKSTGDTRLDRACLDAMYAADFVPPQANGKFIAGATDVYLAWRLPK
jgi:TonB family protein